MAGRTQLSGGNGREARIGEIVDDFLLRRSRGETVRKSGLLARHPDLADELREHFELIEGIRPAQAGIDDLIARGLLQESADGRYLAELGPYRIVEVLGRGGMGIVLKAYEESLNRSVALKILRPDLSADTSALVRFTREAKAAAALQHPNIVTVHAVGSENGAHFIAMEYIDGPTLGETIRERGALPAETARVIFRQLLSALATAHAAGLIHRDIKPSNILLDGGHQLSGVSAQQGNAGPRTPDPEPFIKLADFGLARMMSAETRVTRSDSVLGTPEYMSPEQARGDESIDQRTDLYSTGVVLYEMLTGRPPFKADSPSAVIHQILHAAPPDPRKANIEVDPQLASLALRLMAKSPADRLGSACEALEVLESNARVSSPEQRRRTRRHGSQVVAGLILLAGAVGLVSWLGHRRGEPSTTVIGPRAIIRVDVRRDLQGHSTVVAQYGDDPRWRVFRPIAGSPRDACLVDPPGEGDKFVLVALENAPDGKTLVAFDPNGKRLWGLNPSSDRQWPDCGPAADWTCRFVTAGNLDGKAGDEIIVVANERGRHPTRISIVDPDTREIPSTFWHLGNVHQLEITPNFLGPERPAIVAWATNNQLDGLGVPFPQADYKRPRGEDEPRTKYNSVNVLMVLDPNDMDGLGPPRTPRVSDLVPARPVAYAFLDMANDRGSGTYVPEGQTERVKPTVSELGAITRFALYSTRTATGGPRLRVDITYHVSASETAGIFLIVDQNLQIQGVQPVSTGSSVNIDRAYWEQRWRVIIRNGEYVDK